MRAYAQDVSEGREPDRGCGGNCGAGIVFESEGGIRCGV